MPLLRLLAVAAVLTLCALGGASAAQAADTHRCWTNDVSAGSWQTVDAPGGKVAVHYKLTRPRDRRLAQRLAGDVGNTIYPKLASLLGREPPSDDGHRCQHGPDGRLDVFLAPERRLDIVDIPSGGAAVAHPLDDRPCAPKEPVVVVADPRQVDRWILAHEMFHAFSAAYSRAGNCEDYIRLEEAAATWAAEWIYPRDDVEHNHKNAIERPAWDVTRWRYATWTLFYTATKLTGDPGLIRRYQEATETKPMLEAADSVLPGGFKRFLPLYALHAWNQAPVTKTWVRKGLRQWDRFPVVPRDEPAHGKTKTRPLKPIKADLGGHREASWQLPPGEDVLGRRYHRVLIKDPKVREITIENRAADDPDSAAWAYVKHQGGWEVQDWTDRRKIRFCRDDKPRGNVSELVIIFSNTSYKDRLDADSSILRARDHCEQAYDVSVKGEYTSARRTECEPYLDSGDSPLTSGTNVHEAFSARYLDGDWDLDETSGSGELRGTSQATVEYYATSTKQPPYSSRESETREIAGGLAIHGDGPNAQIELHLEPAEPDQTRPIDADALRKGRPVTVTFDHAANEDKPSPGGPGSCGSNAHTSWTATMTFDPRSAPPATTGPPPVIGP